MSEQPETPQASGGPNGGQRGQEPEAPRAEPAQGRTEPPPRTEPAQGRTEPRVTRAGAVWSSVVAGLVVFVLLIVFFIQNQDTVRVRFLGLDGYVPLGLALLIAAVAGGIVVAVAGGVRILQLRTTARRARKNLGSGRG